MCGRVKNNKIVAVVTVVAMTAAGYIISTGTCNNVAIKVLMMNSARSHSIRKNIKVLV